MNVEVRLRQYIGDLVIQLVILSQRIEELENINKDLTNKLKESSSG